MAHVVIAPLVIAYDDQGRHVYAYEGETLPDQIGGSERARLTDLDLVREVGEPEEVVETEPEEPSEPPRKGRTPRGKAEAPGQGKGLAGLTVEQLLAQAADRGIEVPEGITEVADLVAILEQ